MKDKLFLLIQLFITIFAIRVLVMLSGFAIEIPILDPIIYAVRDGFIAIANGMFGQTTAKWGA